VTESLLVNFVYAPPVGHTVEALRYCLGYHRADPARRIGLILNSHTSTELAGLCPFITDLFTVDLDIFDWQVDAAALVSALPGDWDWVVHAGYGSMHEQRQVFPGLARYYDAARAGLTPRMGTALAGEDRPGYLPDQQLRFDLPDASLAWAHELLGPGRPRIAVLPAGGGPRELYPSTASWLRILTALVDRFPSASFCLLGKLADDDRTRTAFGAAEFERLRGAFAGTVTAIDVPLVEQLAAVSACDVLVSPHSGFGMAALAVGTPWLVLAGNRWPEYFFNEVPFYSVLPDPRRFPCYTGLVPPPLVPDVEGPRSPSMCAARVEEAIAELVEAAGLLIAGALSYEEAMTSHFARLTRFFGPDLEGVSSVDGVHRRYSRRRDGKPGGSTSGIAYVAAGNAPASPPPGRRR
jgi:hypothetical protein